MERIELEIDEFNRHGRELATSALVDCEPLCRDAFLLKPKNFPATTRFNDKKIALTIIGLTHGNEVCGIAVLNQLLRAIASGMQPLQMPIAFILGNTPAAAKRRRFVERDLNRSFAMQKETTATAEAKRARELEGVLNQSAYLLDIHQTREKSESPFFIFPYTKASLALAAAVAPYLPIVTHWGDPFSTEGRCTDEYTNSVGGVGITVELGQNGFGAYQIAAGVAVARATVAVVEGLVSGKYQHPKKLAAAEYPEIYTWSDVIANTSEGDWELVPGWYNFVHVEKNIKIGTINGRDIRSKDEGWLLFPQYPKPEDTVRPTELCRVMRRVKPDELPI